MDMDFANEKEMHPYLVSNLFRPVIEEKSELSLLEQKITDVIVCKNGENPRLFFFELKCSSMKNNRIGVGGSRGRGFQVEILAKRPDYFETHLRWILANPTLKTEREFLFLRNQDVSDYLSSGGLGIKQNNIQPRIFEGFRRYNLGELRNEIERFIS